MHWEENIGLEFWDRCKSSGKSVKLIHLSLVYKEPSSGTSRNQLPRTFIAEKDGRYEDEKAKNPAAPSAFMRAHAVVS